MEQKPKSIDAENKTALLGRGARANSLRPRILISEGWSDQRERNPKIQPKGLPKPNASPTQWVAFVKEEQQNEREMTFVKKSPQAI